MIYWYCFGLKNTLVHVEGVDTILWISSNNVAVAIPEIWWFRLWSSPPRSTTVWRYPLRLLLPLLLVVLWVLFCCCWPTSSCPKNCSIIPIPIITAALHETVWSMIWWRFCRRRISICCCSASSCANCLLRLAKYLGFGVMIFDFWWWCCDRSACFVKSFCNTVVILSLEIMNDKKD